jgi:succinate dehydrogenase / fumarate reductase, cytochrome b subunit
MATMPQTARPLSPHLSVYRWEIQMVVSIVHRATGVFLCLGSLLLICLLSSLASGPDAFARTQHYALTLPGLVLLFGWTWSLAFHLLNGLRHLFEDIGWGFAVRHFMATGWLVVLGSFVLTAAVWACVMLARGAA